MFPEKKTEMKSSSVKNFINFLHNPIVWYCFYVFIFKYRLVGDKDMSIPLNTQHGF